MISKHKRVTKLLAVLTLLLSLMAGCSNKVKSTDKNIAPAPDKSATANAAVTTDAKSNSGDSAAVQEDLQSALLAEMMRLAQGGKIINSEFAVKTTIIDTVEKKLGKPDRVDWVPEAKGNYATYSKYNIVFGFNKGSQIFEARSFDSKFKRISLSMVKKAYGVPAYDVKVNGEEIIGYTAGTEHKILLVFPQPDNGSSDPLMDHYSVLYPRGTVNNMANDPGRQW